MSAAPSPRRPRCRAVLTALAAGFAASGLSRQTFCRAHDLAPATLTRYLREAAAAPAAAPAVSPQWLAVELAPPPDAGDSGLTLLLAGGHCLALKRDFCPVTLTAVLRVLERA